MPEPNLPADNSRAAEKARGFPTSPGVYLMKDAAGRVIYIGKAKNLRSRAGSYFLKTATEEPRTARWVDEIRDIDYLEAESEIDALMIEARLIKDVLPKYNQDLRDQKTFPYLEIFTHEDFPRVRATRQPRPRGTKLFGPFLNLRGLRGAIQVLQKIFRFRTCALDIDQTEPRWRWFRPCLLHSINQCTAPCNLRISKEDYRKAIRRLQRVLEGDRKRLAAELREEMSAASAELRFEEAARLRDEIDALAALDQCGRLERHVQPEVFPIDPKRGLAGLRKVLHLDQRPRIIEGIDIAHTAGEDTVASAVRFIDGLPFRPGYRRMRIREAAGPNDVAHIHQAVSRRLRHIAAADEPLPDILLIDGGRGQLDAAISAMREVCATAGLSGSEYIEGATAGLPSSDEGVEVPETSQSHTAGQAGSGTRRPTIISLAKREELVHVAGVAEPLRLSRHSYALRLLQYVRDESHRFAQHYHHMLRKRSQLGE